MAFTYYALLAVLCTLVPLVVAQNFTVPQEWRNSTSTLTRSQRMQIAYAADDILLQFPFNEPESYLTMAGTDGMNLDMNNLLGFRALTHTDFMTGNTTFKTAVTSNLTTSGGSVLGGSLPIPFTPDALISGLLAMDVYFAYNDTSALTMAQSLWNLVFQSQVQPDQAVLGRLPSLNTTFSSECNSESVAGAVLPTFSGPGLVPITSPEPGSAVEIAASDVGSFLALSSYLYKATQNATYLASAGLSAQFVQKHLANAEVVLAGIDIASCLSNSTEWPGDTGFVLEGLATLSALKNTTYDVFMRNLISTTIPFSSWTESNGTLIADSRVESANVANVKLTTPEYIRGLHEAWASMDPTDPAALYIQSFFMVQYNALLNLASADNMYSLNWNGPAPTQVDSIAQTAALDILNAAIAVGLPDAPSSTSSSSSSSSATSSAPQPPASSSGVSTLPSTFHSKKPIGAIVGGVVGGVAGLLLLLGVFVLWRRRQAKSEEQTFIRNIMETTTVPYTEVQPRPFMSAADRKESFRNGPTSIEPLTASTAAASTSEMREVDHDGQAATPPGSAQVQHEPPPRAETASIAETDDIEAVPGLVDRLNRIMARLPPGGVIEEEPPAYHTR